MWAADAGPVIIVNLSRHRCDAIILIRHLNDPIIVPLPEGTTPEAVQDIADGFTKAPRLGTNDAIKLLRKTWTMIVEPVVKQLLLEVPSGSRVWWYTTGAASRLPLHAAGPWRGKSVKNDDPGHGMMELFVSSYTPSLTALISARTGGVKRGPRAAPTVLAVSQPETPGRQPLPQASKELDCIRTAARHRKLPLRVTVIEGKAALKATVLQSIAKHPWVHLICHGHQDPHLPFSSNFSMEDGPISLLSLLQQDLPLAELAVLSACHSAKVNKDLPDESLHLAAGMMMAGFRSVVGTMWALDDGVAPLVMKEFYREMLPKDGEPKRAADAAVALWNAVDTVAVMKKEIPQPKDKPSNVEPAEPPLMPFMQRINFVHYGI